MVSSRLELLAALTLGGKDIQYFEEEIGWSLFPLFTCPELSGCRPLPGRVDTPADGAGQVRMWLREREKMTLALS